MKRFNAIELLRSQNAVVAVLVLALIAQMPHAATVFYAYSHAQNLWVVIQSIGFAIALEIAVLVFVIRGATHTSWGFALFSMAVNAAYYSAGNENLLQFSAWPFWLLSTGLPIAIALYSHEVADTDNVAMLQTGNMQVITESMQVLQATAKPLQIAEKPTDRQQLIWDLKQLGKTRTEIAETIGCSVRTVDNELKIAKGIYDN